MTPIGVKMASTRKMTTHKIRIGLRIGDDYKELLDELLGFYNDNEKNLNTRTARLEYREKVKKKGWDLDDYSRFVESAITKAYGELNEIEKPWIKRQFKGFG